MLWQDWCSLLLALLVICIGGTAITIQNTTWRFNLLKANVVMLISTFYVVNSFLDVRIPKGRYFLQFYVFHWFGVVHRLQECDSMIDTCQHRANYIVLRSIIEGQRSGLDAAMFCYLVSLLFLFLAFEWNALLWWNDKISVCPLIPSSLSCAGGSCGAERDAWWSCVCAWWY